MKNKFILNNAQNLVRISTPYNKGMGFFIAEYGWIVTKEHIVRKNKSVTITGAGCATQSVDVIYLDAENDLAFLAAPLGHNMSGFSINEGFLLEVDSSVTIIRCAINGELESHLSRVTDVYRDNRSVDYILYDSEVNACNDGAPLLDSNGVLLGICSFIYKGGRNIYYALPTSEILRIAQEFEKGRGVSGVRCCVCHHIHFETEDDSKFCNHCGGHIETISSLPEYIPQGISFEVERMMRNMGFQPELHREGVNKWSLLHGSAELQIAYYEKTGLLTGDVVLCSLPALIEDDLIFRYLLKENLTLQGFSFSIREGDILLSLMIYDRYLNPETMHVQFKNLLEKADQYDNILVHSYGARWKKHGSGIVNY